MYLGQYESDSVMIILGISHLSPADGLHVHQYVYNIGNDVISLNWK